MCLIDSTRFSHVVTLLLLWCSGSGSRVAVSGGGISATHHGETSGLMLRSRGQRDGWNGLHLNSYKVNSYKWSRNLLRLIRLRRQIEASCVCNIE